ncbi:MAG: NAD-binding protein [Streptosporangiales bacterium]|nr:NAD-binding protein [Streptosporangiales bacterium]
MTTVGVIGVGELGSRLARRLRGGGYDVWAYDIDATALASLATDDISVVDTIAELAERCHVVVTCVTDHHAVREVCLGADGMVAAARPGMVLIDTTTSLPSVTAAVADALAERGGYLLDVPVSRGVPAAEQGTLSAMVGGSEETYRAVLPLLRTFATDIARVGDIGTGHAVKLWNMQLMAAHQVALTETLWRARNDGMSVAAAVAAFDDGQARTYLTSNHFPKFVLTGTYDSKFTTGLMRKDLALSLELGSELGVPAPAASNALAVYDQACAAGLAPADNMRLVPFQLAMRAGAPAAEAARAAQAAAGPPDPDEAHTDPTYLAKADADLSQVNRTALDDVVAAIEAYGIPPEVALAMIAASSGTSQHVASTLRCGQTAVRPPSTG